MVLSKFHEDKLWAVDHQRSIIHTSNGSLDWEVQKTGNPDYDANGVFAVNEEVAWVVEDLNYIYYTSNGRQDWHQHPSCDQGLRGNELPDFRVRNFHWEPIRFKAPPAICSFFSKPGAVWFTFILKQPASSRVRRRRGRIEMILS